MSFDVDVTARRGETAVGASFRTGEGATVLFGPSGVGKSSVLQMIAGLLRPDHGHVRVGGATLFDSASRVDVLPHRRNMGYVFQDTRLFPHMSVHANLAYGVGRARRAGGAFGLCDVARFLDVDHLLGRWPRTLSGGEARRVAIGRALLSRPRVLLLDEPTASLDQIRREEVLRTVERVRDAWRLPILMVTHDAAEAERIGRSVVKL